MKDLSLFLLKNTMTAKMRKNIKSFCNSDGSTSTLDQQKITKSQKLVDNNMQVPAAAAIDPSLLLMDINDKQTKQDKATTLEEMIVQLELEEKMSRKRKEEFSVQQHRRMSCVNSSDILRSARNALNQYPRFSLDGKDSMYRSSFKDFGSPAVETTNNVMNATHVGYRKNTTNIFKPSCSCSCKYYNSYRLLVNNDEPQFRPHNHVHSRETRRSSAKCGGQQSQPTKVTQRHENCSVIWCKPGVVAKLMGLEAMPVPLQVMNNDTNINNTKMMRKRITAGAVVNNTKFNKKKSASREY